VSGQILGVNNGVIEIGKSLCVGDAIQDHVYQTCIRTSPASQAKGHSYKLVASPQRSKGHLGLVLVLVESMPEKMVDLNNLAMLSSMLPIGALEIEEISFKAL
jgi:hypothetical protein